MKRLLLALTALSLAACATAGVPRPAALANTSWTLVKLDGQSPLSPRAGLRFLPDRLSATAGCNGMGGSWRIVGGKLVGGPYVSTMMYCEGLMDQERALSALLAGKPGVDLKGNRLVLRALGHTAELVRVPN